MEYRKNLTHISEVIAAITDLSSGFWPMAVICDTLQCFAETENWFAAFQVIQSLCESIDVKLGFDESDVSAIQAFVFLFSDAVADAIYS